MIKIDDLIVSSNSPEFSIYRFLINNSENKECTFQNLYLENLNTKLKDDFEELMLKFGMKLIPLIIGRNPQYTTKSKNIVISTYFKANSKGVSLSVTSTETFDMENFKKIFEPYKEVSNESLAEFRLIGINNGNPRVITRKLKKVINIDLDNSYNSNYSIQDISKALNTEKSGLFLFTGDPGSGKSTLIKYLCQEIKDHKFFYLSNDNFDILSNPNFIDFCLDYLQDAILVLEDCERLLLSRKVNNSSSISNILNLTDGIMGDLINLKIIATLNTTDKLDEALLRKGRLIQKVDFDKLTLEQSKKLSSSLGHKIEITEGKMLTEIYNLESNKEELEESSLGFKIQ